MVSARSNRRPRSGAADTMVSAKAMVASGAPDRIVWCKTMVASGAPKLMVSARSNRRPK